MKVLVLGGGGREHALAWRLSKEKRVSQVFLHPGNAGTWKSGIPTLGDVSLSHPDEIASAAGKLGVELVVIGPEVLLAQGYGDSLREKGFAVVGPGKIGAQLESSKAFAKAFLEEASIPTASYRKVTSADALRAALTEYPIVLKLDGLAAGKGVVVAFSKSDSEDFIHRVWEKREFGTGEQTVVVESFIEGRELSYIGLCDGKTFLPLSSASDYKRLLNNNEGPNTGGMGAISPSPVANPELEEIIRKTIVEPTLRQLQKRGIDYRGALYFGLMVNSSGQPFVLEFNTRFGDPETQALVLRLEGDFLSLLLATAQGRLSDCALPPWEMKHSVYVVAAAEGYPASPRTGDAILGLQNLSSEVAVFFSGVKQQNNALTTDGGRVLGVGALGFSAEDCREKVYDALSRIQWEGMQFRNDIGE